MTARRLQILDAAAELLGEKGYARTSVDDIIERAGLSGKSHFYHYFKSKEELGYEVIGRQFDLMADRGATVLRDESLAPLDRLVAMAREWNSPERGLDPAARDRFTVLLRVPVGGGEALLLKPSKEKP